MKGGKQISASIRGKMGSVDAQHQASLTNRKSNYDKDRPGHDIEDLIVFPGCLEGETCHDSNCKLNSSNHHLI